MVARMRRPTLLFVLPLALTLAACGAAFPASEPHALLDQTPEPRSEPSLEGEMLSFPAKGKITLVDFWATSCAPCVKIMPELDALYREKKAEGFEVVGIATDDNPGLVMNRLKELGVSYPNLLDDTASSLRGAFRVDELPTTFLVDRQGRVRLVRKGGDEGEVAALREAAEQLLAE
jgi:thiol-disulfide isomerase/thioredoxin